MYSYNFLITIRITYEELCIKFSSTLIGPKNCYRHFKKNFIYDLYFLNNNKYLKSFEDKSLSLRDFILEGKLMENLVLTTRMEPCIKFSSFLVIQNFFIDTSKKKSYKNQKNFSVFELQPYKKIDSVENWFCVKIPVFRHFFFYAVHRHKKKQKKKKTHIIVKSIHSSLRSESKKTYIIVKSIHSSLRSESKIDTRLLKT
ncbi:hypothetical protein AGLY_002304 [Aphis glycines]|uniref:Uncharacterized protein n=1 Tax=Aphis glycines TaxID=307491 RepID=A0A6G0U349_APHGL|nr:hypothetical protein AGLY_002304 [Aphis glycines]